MSPGRRPRKETSVRWRRFARRTGQRARMCARMAVFRSVAALVVAAANYVFAHARWRAAGFVICDV